MSIHIVGATLFRGPGALQFAAGFRPRNPVWHRVAGRLLIPCGIAAALSGMWLAQFYPLRPFRVSFSIADVIIALRLDLTQSVLECGRSLFDGMGIRYGREIASFDVR